MLFRIFYDVILKYYRRLIATLVLSAISLPASVVAASLSGIDANYYKYYNYYCRYTGYYYCGK